MSKPKVYEHDLNKIADFNKALAQFLSAREPGVLIERYQFELLSDDGYRIGTLTYEDEQVNIDFATYGDPA